MEPLLLKPALKDYIWGGTRLKPLLGLQTELSRVAEAWVLSCHRDGPSVIQNGPLAGLPLPEALDRLGPQALGANAQAFGTFPILIKLIDAAQNLSVQVHPDDAYAQRVEGEPGKTEFWYVVDSAPGAYLYYGFNRPVSKEEFTRRIAEQTLLDVLNKTPVRTGDCLLIEAGTIHAIGEGLLIAEIQQNSNTTYRVYDYGRKGADGKPRTLHVGKALDVTTLDRPGRPVAHGGSQLARCPYFTVDLHTLEGEQKIDVGADSFAALLCVAGGCTLDGLPLPAGACAFLPANYGTAVLRGSASVLESRI